MVDSSVEVLSKEFPEVGAGGFTSLDGTVEFYGRINALLQPDMTVLDFGAGRGAGLRGDRSSYRQSLRMFKGKVAKVIACDIDRAVLENPGADEIVVVQPEESLPFPDGMFDVIVCDFVFEHVTHPARVTSELGRILKQGGWICARTPNRYGLVSILTRMFSNSWHPRILRRVQPERREVDVFPTAFRLNSMRAIRKWFPPHEFENYTYRYEAEPSYFFNHRSVARMWLFLNRLLPPVMKTTLFVFLRKKM